MKQNSMMLRYGAPAPLKDDFLHYSTYGNAWERYSLPLGNGFFGANLFGRTVTERVQISDPTLANPYYVPKTIQRRASCASGVNNMAELLIDFGHENVSDYERTLSIDDAVHTVNYKHNGITYTRTAFTSHPDRVLVMRFTASEKGKISFTLRNVIPFICDFNMEEGDGMAKSGELILSEGDIVARGRMSYYGILYENRTRILAEGGKTFTENNAITVTGADAATVIFTCATNYELSCDVFTEPVPSKKLQGRPSPTELVKELIDKAQNKGYENILADHLSDYHSLFGRVTVNLCEEYTSENTDTLLMKYKAGERSPYLELLLFQYGRYLMICSSRTLLPANLQGIWNAYADSPWSCGYWHNINLQMNYWSVGPANLSELFIPYINYANAYMPLAKHHADELIRRSYPEKLSSAGENGWIIGTGAWPYTIEAFKGAGHSGPGTGAFTALLFWDHYDYTQDVDFLRSFGYPTLRSMSVLYSKLLVEHDGVYLIEDSASPEQVHNGKYYHSIGCAFDQQMVYECFRRTIDSTEILGERDSFIDEIADILPHLEPVLIGDDGQVKEYREETTYSSIGEPNHRHVSHLVGLYPGTVINEKTPEWIRAAEVTLNRRGDKTHCWAVAHRMLLWARTGNGNRAMDLLQSLIYNNLFENLWNNHPPFQIDGSFGYTAGVSQMLLGGADGVVSVLPALPDLWHSGEFSGLVARGGVTFDCRWKNGKVTYLAATAKKGISFELILPQKDASDNDTSTIVTLGDGERRVIISDK